jgi:hypothetical protein
MDMQMMMQMSGQYTYGSATMLQSASAITTWILAAAMWVVLFWMARSGSNSSIGVQGTKDPVVIDVNPDA